jgi:hypothetical protein
MQRLCPELTALMNLFYTVDGAYFFAVDGVGDSKRGERAHGLSLQVFWLRPGPSGCAGALRHAPCRHRREVAHRRLQPGRAAGEPAGADAVLRRLHGVLNELAAHAKDALDLDLNMAKCALLLSAGHAAAPDCFAGMEVSARGTKVARAPIGDADFCAKFIGQRVDTVLAKIRTLRGMHPQIDMLLLRMCYLPQLNYLAQVVPPSITAQHFARLD